MTLSGKWAGKTALITGASSGIGRAIAQRFLVEGMRVVLFGRNEQSLQQVVQEHDGRELIVVGDVTSAVDRQRLVQSAVEQFGNIDVFVPAAGVLTFTPLEHVTEQVLLQHMNTNFLSIVELTNFGGAAYPHRWEHRLCLHQYYEWRLSWARGLFCLERSPRGLYAHCCC